MTRERFLCDIATHKMTIHLDNGLYRHLEFKRASGSFHQWFEIVTWPHGLALRGDMGDWMFSRVEDMFRFFRSADGKINPDYWSEKCIAACKESVKAWNADVFRSAVIDLLDNYELSAEERVKIIDELEYQVFSEDDEGAARHAFVEFESGVPDFQFSVDDVPDGSQFTGWFLWCLHAIVWAISQYDAAKEDQC